MATEWPATLPPLPLESSYSEQLPKITIRTPMGAGPSKTRRITSRNSSFIDVSFLMTYGQAEDFVEFYRDDLLGGALTFTWKHPRTQVDAVCRIVGDENDAPIFTGAETMMEVSFKLEILP